MVGQGEVVFVPRVPMRSAHEADKHLLPDLVSLSLALDFALAQVDRSTLQHALYTYTPGTIST